MKKFKIILMIFAGSLIIFSVFFCVFLLGKPKAAAPTVEVYFSGQPNFIIHAELARTPSEWSRGLMYRSLMLNDAGMLFVFPQEAAQFFWMKNTKIPLDIIFISAAGVIVDIKNNFSPCIADPCPSYQSVAPAQYVLEINAGLAQKEGIKIGEKTIIGK